MEHQLSEPSNGIAILGGSFDPVHLGHLWIAEAALECLPVEQVRWIPAATSPLKPEGPTASNQQRLQMLRLAIGGATGHVVDDWELKQDTVSYTVETLRHLSEEYSGRRLFLVIGADSLASMDRWSKPSEILDLATLAVVARGGEVRPDYSILEPMTDQEKISEVRRHEISMPQIELSSRDLRQRIARGQSVRFRVPHAVAAMIQSEGMYANG
ncbi:MAG: nicotinate (nicotinamide) nucleotide adenylyltransferase [Planctomycetota bacterium]